MFLVGDEFTNGVNNIVGRMCELCKPEDTHYRIFEKFRNSTTAICHRLKIVIESYIIEFKVTPPHL